MKIYKVLSALLDYPTEALAEAVPELRQALDAEGVLAPSSRSALERLFEGLETADLFELQEHYVALFDRVRSLSLHLFEHVHGESRDRGQALVDLKALYDRHGFALSTSELPDYIPLFLEFLSRIQAEEAADLLGETASILEGIHARLAKRGSAYAAVFEALLSMIGHASSNATVSDEDIRKEDDPATLDAQWEDQPAFGAAPACGAAKRTDVSVIQIHKRAA